MKKFLNENEHFKIEDIGDIILVGNTCNIPYIAEEIEKIFGRKIKSEYDKSTLVAYGAALAAKFMNAKTICL